VVCLGDVWGGGGLVFFGGLGDWCGVCVVGWGQFVVGVLGFKRFLCPMVVLAVLLKPRPTKNSRGWWGERGGWVIGVGVVCWVVESAGARGSCVLGGWFVLCFVLVCHAFCLFCLFLGFFDLRWCVCWGRVVWF